MGHHLPTLNVNKYVRMLNDIDTQQDSQSWASLTTELNVNKYVRMLNDIDTQQDSQSWASLTSIHHTCTPSLLQYYSEIYGADSDGKVHSFRTKNALCQLLKLLKIIEVILPFIKKVLKLIRTMFYSEDFCPTRSNS